MYNVSSEDLGRIVSFILFLILKGWLLYEPSFRERETEEETDRTNVFPNIR